MGKMKALKGNQRNNRNTEMQPKKAQTHIEMIFLMTFAILRKKRWIKPGFLVYQTMTI